MLIWEALLDEQRNLVDTRVISPAVPGTLPRGIKPRVLVTFKGTLEKEEDFRLMLRRAAVTVLRPTLTPDQQKVVAGERNIMRKFALLILEGLTSDQREEVEALSGLVFPRRR